MSFALVLMSVVLFIGLATFLRSVVINAEDGRWVAGMNLPGRAKADVMCSLPSPRREFAIAYFKSSRSIASAIAWWPASFGWIPSPEA